MQAPHPSLRLSLQEREGASRLLRLHEECGLQWVREEARGEPGREGENPGHRREEARLIRFSSSVDLSVDGRLSREYNYSSVKSTKAIRFRYTSSNDLSS